MFALTYEKQFFTEAANRKFRLLLMRKEQLEHMVAVNRVRPLIILTCSVL